MVKYVQYSGQKIGGTETYMKNDFPNRNNACQYFYFSSKTLRKDRKFSVCPQQKGFDNNSDSNTIKMLQK